MKDRYAEIVFRQVVDETKSEKFGHCMEFIHKLFDSGKKQDIMGYNYVFVIVISGNFVFPLFVSLWLPKTHVKHRSKNDIFIEFIKDLKCQAVDKGHTLSEIELSFDSAYCVQKVMKAVFDAEFRVITKPNNNHKFEFDGQSVTPAELIEKVKNGHWKFLDPNRLYQRLHVYHHCYGEIVLIIRRKTLTNGKIMYSWLLCNACFYTANRIDKCYLKRWNIEMQFKYYKQYLNLGKTPAQKIRSHSICSILCGSGWVIGGFVLSKINPFYQFSQSRETDYVIFQFKKLFYYSITCT